MSYQESRLLSFCSAIFDWSSWSHIAVPFPGITSEFQAGKKGVERKVCASWTYVLLSRKQCPSRCLSIKFFVHLIDQKWVTWTSLARLGGGKYSSQGILLPQTNSRFCWKGEEEKWALGGNQQSSTVLLSRPTEPGIRPRGCDPL